MPPESFMRSLMILALAATLAACGQPRVEPEFGQKVRAYLLANPEVLVEAMQELERRGLGASSGRSTGATRRGS